MNSRKLWFSVSLNFALKNKIKWLNFFHNQFDFAHYYFYLPIYADFFPFYVLIEIFDYS